MTKPAATVFRLLLEVITRLYGIDVGISWDFQSEAA